MGSILINRKLNFNKLHLNLYESLFQKETKWKRKKLIN